MLRFPAGLLPHRICHEVPPMTLDVNSLGDFALHERYIYCAALPGRAPLWGLTVPLEGRCRTTYLHMVSSHPATLVMNAGGLTVPLEGRFRPAKRYVHHAALSSGAPPPPHLS
jgi:hypothetical protein